MPIIRKIDINTDMEELKVIYERAFERSDVMRKQLPKARVEQHAYMSRNAVPEYKYINYDPELIKQEYEIVSVKIMEMQMALDKYNQTVQFEVNM